MRKFWSKVKRMLHDVDTSEARKSVASDFKKASYAIFTLFLAALPGAHHNLALALAKVLKVEEASIAVSSWTAAGLVLLALAFRVVAFLLECEYGKKEDKHAAHAKKGKSLFAEDEDDDDEAKE